MHSELGVVFNPSSALPQSICHFDNSLLLIHLRRTIFTIQKGGVYTFEKALYRYPTIQAGCADGGYRGTFQNTFDEFHNIRIDISMQIKEQKGFQVLPKRWVVERTFA